MASTKTARVHPVVLLSIVDAHERRRTEAKLSKDGKTKTVTPQTRTIGTLMGTYERGAINITGAFPIPYGVIKSADGTEEVQVDQSFVNEMLEHGKRTTPYEGPVGWFTTSHHLNEHDVDIHDYYMKLINQYYRVKEYPPVVCMTVNCDKVAKSGLTQPVVYIKTSAGVPGNKRAHTAIFHRVNVDVSTYRAEQVVLDLSVGALQSKLRETAITDGVLELAEGVKEMVEWLGTIGKYVDDVIAGNKPADPQLGRQLMEAMAQGNQLTNKQLDQLIQGSIRDHMMVAYLSQVTKTQLALYEKMVSIV